MHYTLDEIRARFGDLGDGRCGTRVALGESDSAECPDRGGTPSAVWVLTGPGVVTFFLDCGEVWSHGSARLARMNEWRQQ